jgi:Bacterial RNA polymerase, alpha chain C terminal domain
VKEPTSKPTKLNRYIEWMSRGRRTGRIAYVLREWDLPEPLPGSEWARDLKFNAAEELLHDPELKATVAAALKNGVEIVGGLDLELKVKQKPSPSLPDDTRLEDVDLPTRIHKALALNGIRTVGELRGTREVTLLTFQDFGHRSVAYLREQFGLSA